MQDLFYIAVTVGFFVLTVLYVRGCERLRPHEPLGDGRPLGDERNA